MTDVAATSEISLPVVIMRGREPGPVFAITAGIHGGEYVPVVAVRLPAGGLAKG
jgi:predicted deacylase